MKLKDVPPSRGERLSRGLLNVLIVYLVGMASGGIMLGLGFVACWLMGVEFIPLARLMVFSCGFIAGVGGMALALGETNG